MPLSTQTLTERSLFQWVTLPPYSRSKRYIHIFCIILYLSFICDYKFLSENILNMFALSMNTSSSSSAQIILSKHW